MRTEIRSFGGKIIGYVEDRGKDKIVYAFGGKIVARYEASTNTTRDEYGKIVANGDIAVGALWPYLNK